MIIFLILTITGIQFYFTSGTYFLLDSIWFPISQVRYDFWSTSFFWFLNDTGVMLLGYRLFSKLFFITILFLSGRLGALFGRTLAQHFQFQKKYTDFLPLVGILFMMINPVVYERMITQPGVYFAMIMVGYGIYFLLKTTQTPKLKRFFFAGLSRGVGVMMSAHMIFMALLVGIMYAIAFWRRKVHFFGILLVGLGILIVNFNWLVGGFLGSGSAITDVIATFNQANIESFTSYALRPLSLEGTLLVLHGFRGERAGHFFLPETINPLWYLYSFLILAPIFLGYSYLRKRDKKRFFWSVSSTVLALVFASGISSQWFGWINQALFDHLPFYIGLREPQKWIVVALFGYLQAFLLGVSLIFRSIDSLFSSINYQRKVGLSLFTLTMMLRLWVPHLFFAFHNQLTIADYPQDFSHYQAKSAALKEGSGKTLLLPWHSYIGCGWTHQRVVANPLKAYFGGSEQLIMADNIEMDLLYTNSTSPRSADIESFLLSHNTDLLKKHHITRILFADQCADFHTYDFLEQTSGLQQTFSGTFLKAYEIVEE